MAQQTWKKKTGLYLPGHAGDGKSSLTEKMGPLEEINQDIFVFVGIQELADTSLKRCHFLILTT